MIAREMIDIKHWCICCLCQYRQDCLWAGPGKIMKSGVRMKARSDKNVPKTDRRNQEKNI